MQVATEKEREKALHQSSLQPRAAMRRALPALLLLLLLPAASPQVSSTPTPSPTASPTTTPVGCTLTSVAGSTLGFLNGAAAAARFSLPRGLAWVPETASLYIADRQNNRVRALSGGVVGTLAGQGGASYSDGPSASATFYSPSDLAAYTTAAGARALLVADAQNHRLRSIALPSGAVTTLAGTGVAAWADAAAGTAASFNEPQGLAVNAGAGIAYIADTLNHRIRAIGLNASACPVSTLAGNGVAGYVDGPLGPFLASFNAPRGLALHPVSGLLYVADTGNHRIRVVTQEGAVSTLAGGASSGYAGGRGTAARFSAPWALALHPAGATLAVADSGNHALRSVRLADGLVSQLAGAFPAPGAGDADGFGTSATLNTPSGLAYDPSGTLFVSDSNHKVRAVTCGAPLPTPSPTPSLTPGASPSPSPSSAPAQPLAGVMYNVPIGLLTDANCTPCAGFPTSYSSATPNLAACAGPFVFVGARFSAAYACMSIGAIDTRAVALGATPLNVPTLSRGVFWYNTAGSSSGFSGSTPVSQSNCNLDTTPLQDTRLCWQPAGAGYRAGRCTSPSAAWLKELYNCPAIPTSLTNFATPSTLTCVTAPTCPCSPGRSSTGTCAPCAPGTYLPGYNFATTTCIPCPAGEFASAPGASS
jgi:sugar lactone lactonase YvrE